MNEKFFPTVLKKGVHALAFLVFLLAIVMASVYGGQYYFHRFHTQQETTQLKSFDQMLHQQLDISPEQEVKLAEIEKDYQRQLKYLSEKLKLTKMELANAVKDEKKLGPRMEQAIDKNHTILGELQKATMKHLFEMQTVLSPEQCEKMNNVIADALYH